LDLYIRICRKFEEPIKNGIDVYDTGRPSHLGDVVKCLTGGVTNSGVGVGEGREYGREQLRTKREAPRGSEDRSVPV